MKKRKGISKYEKELREIKKKLEAFEQHLAVGGKRKEEGDMIHSLMENISKLLVTYQEYEGRVQDAEYQLNLLTRLVTTLCLENFGFRLSQFRRLIRRLEKETVEDTEVAHLESLYSLEPKPPSHHKPIEKQTDKTPKPPEKT